MGLHITMANYHHRGTDKLKVVWNVRIHHEYEGGIENSVPRITNWHDPTRVLLTDDKR